jgi:hypothetical protein
MNNSVLSSDLFNDLIKKKFNCSKAVTPNRKECHRALLVACFLLVSHLIYFSLIMKMGAVYSSKISIDFCQTIGHSIPEDSSLHRLYFLPCLTCSSVLKMEAVYLKHRCVLLTDYTALHMRK